MTSEQNQDQNGENSTKSTEHIRDALTSDYVVGVKERAALKEELSEVKKELDREKGKNYDLMKKIEKLEKEATTNKKNTGKGKKPAKRKAPKHKENKEKKKGEEKDEIFESSELLYEEIAKRFPTLPLSTILMAQEKFTEADVNNDGTVDFVELEKMLDSASLMFTKENIKDILVQIDADSSNSLDFFECLQVCDHLHNNRKSKLPQAMQQQQQQKSALCSIQ